MRQRIDIRGVIIPNDLKDIYDWIGWENTTPGDVNRILNGSKDDVDVYINSNGGEIASGSEIYTMLRDASANRDVQIIITGAAHSAASVIACSAHSKMAPTALMMVHCVSSCAAGNHMDLEHEAEILKTADHALSSAYTAKTGMTQEEILDLMEHETWLTAERAKELGFVDEIMFDEPAAPAVMAAAAGYGLLSDREIQRIKAMMGETVEPEPEERIGYSAAEIAQAQRLQQGRLALCRKE